jgi:HAD superfamily hydrolase (TIGR01490 family)
MKLALFDLDHTLLPIDSADRWSHYLVEVGGLDAESFGARIREFALQYREGRFDVPAYVHFQMNLMARFDCGQLEAWRGRFIDEHIAPHVLPPARALVAQHRADGAEVALVSGTHAWVTTPIARLLGIEVVIGYRPEERDGRFTGGHVGVPTYREGKVAAVELWLAQRSLRWDQVDSTFYSDSINDLPLLERVRVPVVTNGDPQLRRIAAERGWRTLELFAEPRTEPVAT